MSDISITASLVISGPGVSPQTGVSGTTITAGQALYVDTANSNVLKLADANATAPANVFAGIARHAALAGQPINYALVDPAFQFGGTILSGDTVYLSDTPGGLTKAVGDLAAGSVVTVVGVMTSTTVLNLQPVAGGAIA